MLSLQHERCHFQGSPMHKNIGLSVLLLISTLFINGCVSYGNYPDIKTTTTAKQNPHLKFQYTGTTGWFGGGKSIEATLRNEGNFKSVEKLNGIEDDGLFINIKTKPSSPSVAAALFGYISFSTLTFTPFWSTQDGYEILFEVHKDGKRLQNYNYDFNRNTFIWMPMIVLSWINFFTPSEEDAFVAVTRQFLKDAQPILMSK